jgi:prolyl-tRNA synthetase
MRLSGLFSKSTRQAPSDETARNAQLLMRAGYVSKSMAGAYSFLPLGLRVLRKVEAIVRSNMDAIGGQEVLMNNLQPKEWWEKVGSWDHDANDALFHLPSLNLPGTEYALSSSNEENVTTIAAQYINSWKDLPEYTKGSIQWPLAIYHIHTKFRDEMRAKAGLMRGREFRMKDMYDFHRTKESQAAYFEVVTQAYLKSYQEAGLDALVVNASGGAFSDKFSREFQVFCEAGEDRLYVVPDTKIAYNEEVAPTQVPDPANTSTEQLELTKHDLPGVIGVNQLVKQLGITAKQATKTLFYMDQHHKLVVIVVRSDREVSEEKLRAIHKSKLRLATNEEILTLTGCEVGYAGLYNLQKIEGMSVYVDDSCQSLVNWECGGNESGVHMTNVNWGRDVPSPSEWYDIKAAKEGDIHPATGKVYEVRKGAEVGNIFDLGTRYTEALGVRYTDENNQPQTPYMGCHGIGITRMIGVLAEIYSDEKGLKWPEQVAPYKYHLISFAGKNDDLDVIQQVAKLSEQFYLSHPDQVLWDDRGVGMGEKFNDADLLGCPIQLVISSKSISSNQIEVRRRDDGTTTFVPLDQLSQLVAQ